MYIYLCRPVRSDFIVFMIEGELTKVKNLTNLKVFFFFRENILLCVTLYYTRLRNLITTGFRSKNIRFYSGPRSPAFV